MAGWLGGFWERADVDFAVTHRLPGDDGADCPAVASVLQCHLHVYAQCMRSVCAAQRIRPMVLLPGLSSDACVQSQGTDTGRVGYFVRASNLVLSLGGLGLQTGVSLDPWILAAFLQTRRRRVSRKSSSAGKRALISRATLVCLSQAQPAFRPAPWLRRTELELLRRSNCTGHTGLCAFRRHPLAHSPTW